MSTLFDPLKVGAIDLKNRVVMAPLTPKPCLRRRCAL